MEKRGGEINRWVVKMWDTRAQKCVQEVEEEPKEERFDATRCFFFLLRESMMHFQIN